MTTVQVNKFKFTDQIVKGIAKETSRNTSHEDLRTYLKKKLPNRSFEAEALRMDRNI